MNVDRLEKGALHAVSRNRRYRKARRQRGPAQRLGLQYPVQRQDHLSARARRHGRDPVRHREIVRGGGAFREGRRPHAGILDRGERPRPRGQARARRLRDERDGPLRDPARGALSDHAEGARDRLSHGQPPPVAAEPAAARDHDDQGGSRPVHPRFLRQPRLHQHGYARVHAERVRGDDDALRDRVLRRQGLPHAERAALQRGDGRRVPQGILLRPDLPRGEVEDAPAPHRVLDGGAGGRIRRARRHHPARRGFHRRDRRPLARELPARSSPASSSAT